MGDSPARGSAPSKLTSVSNHLYNRAWVTLNGLNASATPERNHPDGRSFQVVWLRNVDRLIRAAQRHGADTNAAHFVDVGCGVGIPSIYAERRYDFAGASGFDLDPSLVDVAKANSKASGDRCEFWVADANHEVLPSRKTVLFMFNPFGAETARKFLNLNAPALIRTGSVALLANDHLLPVFMEHGTLLWRSQRWNCSVVALKSRVHPDP